MTRIAVWTLVLAWAGAGLAGAQESPVPPEEAAAPAAVAAEALPAPNAPVTQDQVQALKQQIEALSQQVKVLERQLEVDKEAAAEKAKTTPVVTAGTEGVTLSTPDKAFTMKIGGFMGYDLSWFDQDKDLKLSLGDEQDGTGFRFARIRLNGTVYDNIDYVMEYDFASETGAESPSFKDVYLELKGIPYGGGRTAALRAGHFREPFSLEELTSIRYRTFMETGLVNALVPSRNPGIQISDALLGEEKQERLTYALGIFKNADDWPSSNDSDEDQGYTFTGRITGLPFYRDAGKQLLHLGAAYSHRNPDGAVLGYAARPENRLSLFRYVNAEGINLFRLRDARADTVDLYGLELGAVYGPWHFSSEYALADVDTTFDHTRQFDGYYAQLGYFLTGESRPYRNSSGVWDKVKPARNFGWKAEDGWGAWELALRYSGLDLDSGGVRGGEQEDLTLGLNWYLNPNTRIMWNYVRGDVDHDLYSGDIDSLQMRFQVEF